MIIEEKISELQDKLGQELKKKRYMHTLGVQYTAANLAMCYGEDMMRASLAGLLHDCAKCMPDKKLLICCRKYELPISETEERNPYLLHAKLGAYFAKEKYKIEDEELLSSIIYHTTGRPNMTLLEKIIFTADYIEPGRKQIDQLTTIRNMAYHDLDKAVYIILKNTLSFLREQEQKGKKEIDPMTIEAYNYYEQFIQNREKGIIN